MTFFRGINKGPFVYFVFIEFYFSLFFFFLKIIHWSKKKAKKCTTNFSFLAKLAMMEGQTKNNDSNNKSAAVSTTNMDSLSTPIPTPAKENAGAAGAQVVPQAQEGGGDGEENEDDRGDDGGGVTLSKRQQRKAKRLEYFGGVEGMREFWRQKTAAKKDRKRQRRAEERAAQQAEWESLTPEEQAERKEKAARIHALRREAEAAHEARTHSRLYSASSAAASNNNNNNSSTLGMNHRTPILAIDLQYEHTMCERGIRSTVSQIKVAYSALSKLGFPFRYCLVAPGPSNSSSSSSRSSSIRSSSTSSSISGTDSQLVKALTSTFTTPQEGDDDAAAKIRYDETNREYQQADAYRLFKQYPPLWANGLIPASPCSSSSSASSSVAPSSHLSLPRQPPSHSYSITWSPDAPPLQAYCGIGIDEGNSDTHCDDGKIISTTTSSTTSDTSRPSNNTKLNMVYLTADSPNVLTTIEPATAYIIGGFVDRNSEKGLTYRRATERPGLGDHCTTARLPISECGLDVATLCKVLTINHVVDVMGHFYDTLQQREEQGGQQQDKEEEEENREGQQQQHGDEAQGGQPSPVEEAAGKNNDVNGDGGSLLSGTLKRLWKESFVAVLPSRRQNLSAQVGGE